MRDSEKVRNGHMEEGFRKEMKILKKENEEEMDSDEDEHEDDRKKERF